MAAAPGQQFFSMEGYKQPALRLNSSAPFSQFWSGQLVLRGVVVGQAYLLQEKGRGRPRKESQ